MTVGGEGTELAPDLEAGASPAFPRAGNRLPSWLLRVLLIAMALVVALGMAAALLALTGYQPWSAFSDMWQGSFGSKEAFFTTLNETAPLLIVAIGACIALRAGLINLGLEGQFLIGGLAAVAVAVKLHPPGVVALPLMFGAAVVAGAAWAGVAALLRFRRGVNEVLVTLLMYFVAVQLASWLLDRESLLQAGAPRGAPSSDRLPQSELIPGNARLPFITRGPGFALQAGIVFAIVIAIVCSFAFARTKWGFNLRVVGLNARVARRFGVRASTTGAAALMLSGALAAFAGAVFLTGGALRVTPDFASDYGFEGLLVALIAQGQAIVAIPVALLYGALRAGGGLLSASGVSTNVVAIIQALVVLAVMLPALYVRRREQRRASAVGERT